MTGDRSPVASYGSSRLALGEDMKLLQEGARDLGLHLTSHHLRVFQLYYQELDAWNRKYNLTTVTGYDDVQLKHFLDSLTGLLALPVSGGGGCKPLPSVVPLSTKEAPLLCIDVGTGAGFPGLPIKIMRPAVQVTLLDSTRKKIDFLEHLVKRLDLDGVQPLWGRAEQVGQDAHHRERYDVAFSRAVAGLAVLAEYCLPLCRVGGCFIAHKGVEIDAELQNAVPAIAQLGGRLRDVRVLRLPGLRDSRSLIVIDKVAETPAKYPRRAGMPAKRPLTGS